MDVRVNFTAKSGGSETAIQGELRNKLEGLNVTDGLRAKIHAIGERWGALGQDKAIGLFTRITNALFGLSEGTINLIVCNIGTLSPAEVAKKFNVIITNFEATAVESSNVWGLDAARSEAAADVCDVLLPANATPEEQVAVGDVAGQIVDGQTQLVYNQRYQEILRPALERLRTEYDSIGENPPKPLSKKYCALLENPNPAQLNRHLELAHLMRDLSRIVRYGCTSDMQFSPKVIDLGQAHNPDVLSYDAERNEFICPDMPPEFAEFCTTLKREFDASFRAITKPYRNALPGRITYMEEQARQKVLNQTERTDQASLALLLLCVEIQNLNTQLGYTGNTCSISVEEGHAARNRIIAMKNRASSDAL